jgi:hypothetical protein
MLIGTAAKTVLANRIESNANDEMITLFFIVILSFKVFK